MLKEQSYTFDLFKNVSKFKWDDNKDGWENTNEFM